MSTGVRELRVWQESVTLAGDVVRAVRQGMRRETRSVSDSLMATAVAVSAHIAQGYACPTPPEQRESYLAAKLALARLESELAVAKHAELLPAGAFADLAARSGQVAKLLTGYLVYLDRQMTEDRGATPGSGRAPS